MRDVLIGTKRKAYSSSRVRKMRSERMLTKAKKEGVSNEQVQHYLGKLQAAGHMRLSGMNSFDAKIDADLFDEGRAMKTTTIKFNTIIEKGMGEKPHMTGYLTSASDMDSKYKLKGWFNEDGTFRIELVN
jgi:phospholipase/lecithinase/hemolysin